MATKQIRNQATRNRTNFRHQSSNQHPSQTAKLVQSLAGIDIKERELLRPLPATMPEPFDLIKQAQVYKDCTIRFEGKTFAVPFRYAHKTVEVRGCAHIIQVVDPKTGEIVHELPRNTRGLVLIDQACYEPTDAERLDDSIPKPLPLGAMAKRIEELASTGAPCRSIDFYESLAALKAASHK